MATVTLNVSQILLNEPCELWPVWWDRQKCIELIQEMERAGFGPSYYTNFQAVNYTRACFNCESGTMVRIGKPEPGWMCHTCDTFLPDDQQKERP